MSKEIFTRYYDENSWNGRESLSGPGSDSDQTKHLIPELQILLEDLSIKTMLDVPCGDFNWMKNVNLDRIKYIGGDIVNKMIKVNNKRYGSNNIYFEVIDIVNDDLPRVDLIMVRDCFVHLTNNDIKSALNNIKNSNSKYILTTNFTWKSNKSNNDIPVGGWRRLNLQNSPFNLPFPKQIIIEGNTQSHDRDKTMSLWEVKDIPGYVI
jgi:SAM-dependent methyltransferase